VVTTVAGGREGVVVEVVTAQCYDLGWRHRCVIATGADGPDRCEADESAFEPALIAAQK
jgi:hypothetical protein